MPFDKYKTCKDCPDRIIGCHSTCDGYKSRCEEQKRINETRRAMNNSIAPTDHREQVGINYYKRKRKEKIYKR